MSRRRKKSGGVFSGFVAAVLSLVVFICLTGLIGVISMEQIASQKNVRTVVKELNLKELAGAKMGEAQKYLVLFGLPDDTMDQILESDAVSGFISDYAADCMNYIVLGKDAGAVTADELSKVFGEGLDEVAQKNGLNISQEARSALMFVVEQASDYVVAVIPTPQQVAGNISPSTLNLIHTLFAPMTKVLLIVLIVCMLFLTGLVRRSMSQCMLWAGIAALPAGLIYLFLGTVGRGALAETLAGNGALGSMVEAAGNGIFAGFVKWGGIAAGAAVVLFILYGVVKHRTDD